MDKYHPVKVCIYCGKKVCAQNIDRHTNQCDLNPSFLEKKIAQDLILQQTLLICKKCKRVYSLKENGSSTFCSRACANSHTPKEEPILVKEARCTICGKLVLINKRRSAKKLICKECKQDLKRKKRKPRIHVCSFCGRSIHAGSIKIHEKSCKLNPNKSKTKRNFHRKDVRTGYIYIIRNCINNKIYIGKKAGDPDKSKSYYGSGLLIKKAILKYGRDSFSKEILEVVVDSDLNEKERFWIKKFHSNNSKVGYNLTAGGDGGHIIKNNSSFSV